MKEQDFKSTYQNELSQLHAPLDLIEKTKQMAAFEEKRYRMEKKRKHYFTSFATAAALLVICFSVYFMTRPVQQNGQDEQGTTIHLGGHAGDKDIVLEEKVEVNNVTILPMAFNGKDCTEQEVEDVDVKLTLIDGQYYMAAFEEEESYIVVKSQITEKEAFVEVLKEILEEYGE